MDYLVKALEFTAWGWCAVVYTDSDGGSGYGDTPRVGHWYGTRAECESLDPRKVKLVPMTAHDRPDAFDVACERRHD